MNTTFTCNSGVWQLLSSFYLIHSLLCDCDIKEKGLLLLCISKYLRGETIEWKLYALLCAEHNVSEVANYVGECRTTVDAINRSAWTMAKVSTDVQAVVERLLWIVTASGVTFETVLARTSIRQYARRLGVEAVTVRQAVSKLGAKSRVIVERPLLMPAIRAKRLERCQMLVNNLKPALDGRVIIFSDKKNWTVDPVKNRRNDRYLSLVESSRTLSLVESSRTLSKTKHL